MAWLEIDKVHVYDDQAGEPGGDELYFKVGGQKVGPTTNSLETGDTYDFDPVAKYFKGSIDVSLFEDDPDWWWGGDDYIATTFITDTPGQGILKYMDGGGGMYDVYFNVYA